MSCGKNVLLFLIQGEEILGLDLSRKGEVREPFLHLLFLKRLQLKIVCPRQPEPASLDDDSERDWGEASLQSPETDQMQVGSMITN